MAKDKAKADTYAVSGAIEIPPAGIRLEDGETITHAALLEAGQTEEHIQQLLNDGDLVVPGEG